MKIFYFFMFFLLFFISSSLCFSEQEIQEQLEFEKHVTVKDHGDGQVHLIRHTVQRGEHLLKILRKIYGVDLEDLGSFCRITAEVNPEVHDIHHLLVGQVIMVPYKFEKKSDETGDQKEEYHTEHEPQKFTEQMFEDEDEINIHGVAVDPAEKDFIEHEVKQGEYYGMILRNYGLSDNKIYSSVTKRIIKHANPEIDDLDRLRTGQVFRIPAAIVSSSKKGYPTGTVAPSSAQRLDELKPELADQDVAKTAYKDDSVTRTVSSLVHFFQGSGKTADGTEIPLVGRSTLRLDFSKFPMYELPWGRNFVLDYGNKLPVGLNEMFAPEWKNTEIISVAETDDSEMVLDKIFEACGFFRVEKNTDFTVNRDNIQISVNGRWVIFKDESLREIYVFNIIKDDSSRFPGGLKQYFVNMGVKILEIKDGFVQKEKQPLYAESEVRHKKVASDTRSLTDSLLSILQPDYKTNYPIQIVQGIHEGFSLEVIADRAFNKDGTWHIIDFEGLPKKIVSIANRQGMKVVAIERNADPVDVIERVLDFWGAEYLHPPAQINSPPFNITLPGFLVKNSSGDILITRQSFDEDFRQVISELGVTILEF